MVCFEQTIKAIIFSFIQKLYNPFDKNQFLGNNGQSFLVDRNQPLFINYFNLNCQGIFRFWTELVLNGSWTNNFKQLLSKVVPYFG